MAEISHQEWTKENSLTTPADRDRNNLWKPEQGMPSLTEDEVLLAVKDLNNTDFVKKFPRVDRTYSDTPPPMQNIGLISFVPSKGATPDSQGIYGFAKLRGNYATPIEANQRSEFLIRNADSYHQIYHTYVGRPFPITASSKYSAETEEIDIRKATTEAISSSIRDKKLEEQNQVAEIRQREEKLIETARNDDPIDSYENYITLRVKKAQLIWTYLEHEKKMAEIKEILINTKKEVADLDAEHPTYIDTYYQKYVDARKDAGIDGSNPETHDNFIKYMVEDVEIPGI
jgi:hypothetical protein